MSSTSSAPLASSAATRALRLAHVSNLAVLVLALTGLGFSTYLTLSHLGILDLVCDESVFRCDEVASHPLSQGLGLPFLRMIPTAAFGGVMFLALAGVCLLRGLIRSGLWLRRLSVLQWAMTLVSLLAALGLTYAEAFVIHAWCLWCLATAASVLVAFAAQSVSSAQLRAALTPVPVEPVLHSRGEKMALWLPLLLGLATIAATMIIEVRFTPQAELADDQDVAAVLAAPGHSQGKPDAPFTLVEFGSFACPHCRAAVAVVDELLREHPDQLRVVFNHARKASATEGPLLQALAAEAAERQGKYWPMHHALYADQLALLHKSASQVEARLLQIAVQMGLDPAAFLRDLRSDSVVTAVQRQEILARRVDAFPVPKFFFISPEGEGVFIPNARVLKQWLADPANWEAEGAGHEPN
jgi:protein-disulfide isomerase